MAKKKTDFTTMTDEELAGYASFKYPASQGFLKPPASQALSQRLAYSTLANREIATRAKVKKTQAALAEQTRLEDLMLFNANDQSRRRNRTRTRAQQAGGRAAAGQFSDNANILVGKMLLGL